MNRPRPHDDPGTLALSGARIERLMNVVRWAASGLILGIGPFLPNVGFEAVIGLGAGMFVLSALVALLGRFLKDSKGRSVISHLALAGDALAGMAAVLVFPLGPERGAAMAVGVVLIGTGAFRGGIGGCIATLAATAVGFVGAEAIRYDAGGPLDLSHIALTLVAYAFAAVVFMGWHAEVRRVVAERGATAARLTLVGRAANDVIYEWDIPSGALVLSAATGVQLGYDLTGHVDHAWWEERLHPEDAGPVRDALATALKSAAREWEMEYRFRKADGTFTTVHDRGYVQWSTGRKRRAVRMVGTLVNVDSVSLYDTVTGLAGRALYTDRVERRAVRGAISDEPFAAIVVDIDGFRDLCARLGQARGDQILVELSRRFETHLGDGETVARVAHDQLGFLVNAKTADDAVARAAQIRDSARIPFEDARLDVVAGTAVLPKGGAPDLMRHALAALADAKRTKRRVAVYEPGGEKRWQERVRLRDDLAGALARRELVLHYQPIADAATGRCVALEALIRWDHPSLGMLDAGDLLQVASDLDLGSEIDRWVLYEATRAVSELRQIRPDLGLSVNIAVRSLDEQFPVSLRAVLAAALLPGDALTIELPEDAALSEGVPAAALKELRALGVGLAIDDFGTGYASLMPAPAIPATVVKIDRVFAARVTSDEHATRIVRAAVERARELGLRVVGEGVEDEATVARLRALSVDQVQGRGVATPMTLKAVTQWLVPADSSRALKPAAAAKRPMMIGENEAVTFRAGEAAASESAAPALELPALAALEVEVFAALAPQPLGPDPMGWILPEAKADAPAVVAAAEPSLADARATAFAPAFVPAPEPAKPLVTEPAAAWVAAEAPLRSEPATDKKKVELPKPKDLRIIALESAGRRWDSARGRGDEETDRLDERLVLLREYASRQALRVVAG